MPRTKGSKNCPKTTHTDYASQIAEKQETIASLNSIDAAVICLEIEEISFETTDYVIGEVHKGDGVLAQGFPGSETEIEELLNYVEGTYGRILHNAKDKKVLLWQIEDAFLVNQPHQVPDICTLSFVKENEKYGWRIFQIGEPVIKYKESGSIMDWIKYIKENKRKRK